MIRDKITIIILAALVLAPGIFIPVAGAGFLPDGGPVSDPVEIAINSTILAWDDTSRTTLADRNIRWQYNPEAFAIVSGDERSRNATFIALRDTGRPEAISYGRNCSGKIGTDTGDRKCSTGSIRYWRIIDIPRPTAGFSIDSGRDGMVRFTDTTEGPAESRIWDFGDKSGSTERNPSHTYAAPGKYTVRLKIANRGGESTATDIVEISTPGRKSSASITGTAASSPILLTAKSYPNGTVTVLHFNNAGPVEDAMGHSWFGQNLLHSDTISKFGGGSALFNGNAWIATNDTVDFSPGSENFTFSAWVYPTSYLDGYGTVWGNWMYHAGGTSLDFNGYSPRIVIDNSANTQIITGTRLLPLNKWSNVVLQGKNVSGASDVTLYVNGIPNGTLTGPYNIRKPAPQTDMYMGRSSTLYYLLQAGTYIDDFFIVKGGPALYEGPFTPPDKEFGDVTVPPQTEFYVFSDGVGIYHDNSSPLGEANKSAENFYNSMIGNSQLCSVYNGTNYCWNGRRNPLDDATGSKYWNISESADTEGANSADFAFHSGHANNVTIHFSTNNGFPDVYISSMRFSRAKWVALASCDVLNSSYWRETWTPVFDGTHLLMGFDTDGNVYREQGTEFATRMTGGLIEGTYYQPVKIREAWENTMKHTINRADVTGAYISADPCKEDYLPGYGNFCPTPIQNGDGNYVINHTPFTCI